MESIEKQGLGESVSIFNFNKASKDLGKNTTSTNQILLTSNVQQKQKF